MKFILKLGIFIFDILLAVIVLVIFTNLTWQFAHSIIDGPTLTGNDSPFVIALLRWFAKFWPRIPIWFPNQGTGVSITYSYPMLGFTSILAVAKSIHMSLSQTYRIFSFLMFPITAWGVYFLTKSVAKSRMAGFLAGIFYLLSQASWVFYRLHGNFAQSLSLIFVPFVFLFFDRGLSGYLKGQINWGNRLDWILGSVFYGFSVIAHPVTGTVIGVAVVLYGFLITLFYAPKPVWKHVSMVFGGLFKIGVFLILGIGAAAFWFIPYYSYNLLSNRYGMTIGSMSFLAELALWPKTILGFNNFATGDQRVDYFFFALPILLLFVLGWVSGWFRNKKLVAGGLAAFASIIFIISPLYFPFLISPLKYVYSAVSHRAIMVALIFMPLVAAAGLQEFWQFLLGWWLPKISKFPKFMQIGLRGTVGVVVAAITLMSGYFMIKTFPHEPPDDNIKQTAPYGVAHYDAYGPALDSDWKKTLADPANLLKTPDKFEVTDDQSISGSSFAKVAKELNFSQFDRIDVSPFALGGAVVKQEATEVSDVSVVNLYHSFATLNRPMWGYQAGVFFGKEPLYDNVNLLRELTDWYGINYVFVTPENDRAENYEKAGYEKINIESVGGTTLALFKYSQTTTIGELTDKPAILVIGNLKQGAFEQIFRIANYGALPYRQALLVEGSKNIDDYSLAELKNYQGIILHGYSYKSGNRAWNLIKQYVEEGGGVFINTGWQYISKEWGTKDARPLPMPKIIPVSATVWKNLPEAGLSQAKVESKYSEGIEIKDFGKLDWRGEPWGLAAAKTSDLRSGAASILSIGDDVLMAQMPLGKGKIVWSGFNIFSHLLEYRNQEEADFMHAVFTNLWSLDNNRTTMPLQFERTYPDAVKFKLSKSTEKPLWLLWKESYTPEWKMQIKGGGQLKLNRAGPAFMLARIPASGSGTEISLDYRQSFFNGIFAKTVTAVSLILLILYIFLGDTFEVFADKIFVKPVSKILQRQIAGLRAKDSEDY